MNKRTGLAILVIAAVHLSTTLFSPPSRAELRSKTKQLTTLIGETTQDSTLRSSEIDPAVVKALGITPSHKTTGAEESSTTKTSQQTQIANPGEPRAVLPATAEEQTAAAIRSRIGRRVNSSGLPDTLNIRSALSAALITNLGGTTTPISEVDLLADWDGREDMTSDRAAMVADLTVPPPPSGFALTRAAISEHTFANGHNFNDYYYGDSLGTFTFGFDVAGDSAIDLTFPLNIPNLINTGTDGGFTLVNPTPADCSDPEVVITGIAVNPVADLGDISPALCGTVGEAIYVSTLETTGCALNGSGQPIRTRIFALAVFEIGGTLFVTPQVRQIVRTSAESLGGLTVDDDGSLYFALVDLSGVNPATGLGGNGGAIFKATELSHTSCAGPARINRTISDIPGLDGSTNTTFTQSTPISNATTRLTNYSGSSAVFGNIASITAGPNNVIYAASAASNTGAGDPTQGLFKAPAAFSNGLPSMVMTFVDVLGGFDSCTSPVIGFSGTLPVGNGIADPAGPGTAVRWRSFVLGSGPDIRTTATPLSFVTGTPTNTQKLSFQVDFTIYSGLAVNEEGTVFVISGGTPSAVANNPSPDFSEILGFEDRQPSDRRADYVDFRGDNPPVPPASGGNNGDGDSDRFDHIFYQAAKDPGTMKPVGLAGLAPGFLRYTNRLAPNPISPGVTLGLAAGQTVQGDDSTDGPIIFENLDTGHQVAGGDDQNSSFTGDDNDGAGNPAVAGPLNGGFEFAFGGPTGANSIWNAFFLNSNGNITFGTGDTDNSPSVIELRPGPPRIAAAWSDLNPAARSVDFRVFPVQALGFANVNAFKVRYINVPEFGSEICTANGGGQSNNFSITLYDDGTGIDENANQPLNPANPIGNNASPFDLLEGPTDQRFTPPTVVGAGPAGERPRPEGSGFTSFDYGRMDLLGTQGRPVLTGYSVGLLAITNPPGICEGNLSELARAADNGTFGVLPGGQFGSVRPGVIGEGTEPTVFEFFDAGIPQSLGSGGQVFFATPDYDLRFAGNDPAASRPLNQVDQNRGRVDLFGIGLNTPANPLIQQIFVMPQAFTPNAGTDLLDAIGAVDVAIVGSGFYPNEMTVVCQGAVGGNIPQERPGKTVTTAATLSIDNNMDGIFDVTVALANVTVVNKNLVTARLVPLLMAPGTAFPFLAVGGNARLTLNTTFTIGDNNLFDQFVRSASATVTPGLRAPIVLGVSQTSGDCSVVQNFQISGANFTAGGVVTSVFAVEDGNPANVIPASSFVVNNNTLIDATFDFGGVNLGRKFLIFVSGPGGTSRNIVLPATPTGNEQGNIIRFNCISAVVPDTFQFAITNTSQTEDCTVINLTVTRINPSAGTATVDYSTSDVTATQRSDYEVATGTLTFGPGEITKTIPILINEDSFVEGDETLSVLLSNPSGGGAVAGGLATLTIVDDDFAPPSSNPIDDASTFVCQQYHDFLNRQPDAAGLAFWTNEITSCGANAACIATKRQNVSAAFFLSIEFQETGFNVIRTQRAAFGRKSDSSSIRFPYFPFMHDAQQVGRGVIIGQPGATALLDQNKQQYATQIATSSAFIAAYPLSQTAAEYVTALFASAMVTPTGPETTAAITAFGAGGTAGRVAALRSVVDSNSVRQAELSSAFVLMQYYGYLRRNPTDPPDVDDSGYQFWLNKLNQFGGNFELAEMVKSFLNSGEYRGRFGP